MAEKPEDTLDWTEFYVVCSWYDGGPWKLIGNQNYDTEEAARDERYLYLDFTHPDEIKVFKITGMEAVEDTSNN